MNLFRFEARKLLRFRFLLVLIALLLISSATVCFFTTQPLFSRSDADVVRDYVDTYIHDEDAYEAWYKEFSAALSAKQPALIAAWEEEVAKNGLIPFDGFCLSRPDLYDTHIFSDRISDRELWQIYKKIDTTANDYQQGLKNIFGQSKAYAEYLYKRFGCGMENDEYRYQVYVYEKYKNVEKNAVVDRQLVTGWEELFSYSYGDVFLFASLMLFSLLVFIPEKQCGMLPILRSTKNGRLKTTAAKSAFAALGALLLTLAFSLSSFLVILMKCGYSDPTVSAQNVSTLTLFPEAWSILGYYLYSLMLKNLVCLCFCAFCAFVSVISYHTAVSFGVGAGMLGLSYFFSALPVNNYPLPGCLNLFSAANGLSLSSRLRVIQPFHACIDYLLLAPVFYALLAVLFFAWILLSSLRVHKGAKTKRAKPLRKKIAVCAKRLLQKAKRNRRKKRVRFSPSIFLWESRKLFFSNKPILWTILGLLIVQIAICTFSTAGSTRTHTYRLYTAFLLPETEGAYSENGERFEELIGMFKDPARSLNKLQKGIKKGEINKDDVQTLMKNLETVRDNALSGDFESIGYRNDELMLLYEAGKDPYIIDYHDYERLFGGGMCIPLYAAILLLGAYSFTIEYTGKSKDNRFAAILRASKNGRQKTFRAKFLFSAFAGTALAFIFYGVEYLSIIPGGVLNAWDAPLCSVPSFSAACGSVTIGQYALVLFIGRILAAVLFALFVSALSQIAQNLLLCLSASVGVTLIPTLLYAFGLKNAGLVSFGDFFSVNGMMKYSVEKQLFASDFGVLVLYGALFAAVTLALVLIARRRFVK